MKPPLSASPYAYLSDCAWYVQFYGGSFAGNNYRDDYGYLHVRLVRSGQ